MICRPRALLSRYKSFTPVCLDYGNVVTAAISQDSQRRWWRKLKPSELSIDLGKIVGTIAKAVGLQAPELKAKWDLNLQNRVASETALDQAKKEELLAAAVKIQTYQLKRHYCHNIDYVQALSSSDRDLLRCNEREVLPLSQLSLKHGDLVVVDTLLEIAEEHIYAADYPAFIAKAADTRILLRSDNSVRTLLLSHPAFKMRWCPYCRILARYVSLGESQPVLDLLLLSARSFGRLDRAGALETTEEVKQLTSQYSQELDRSTVATKLELHVTARTAEGADVPDQEALIRRNRYRIFSADYEHEKLEKIRKFEDDIFAGPYSFWLGLNYFLNTYRDGPNTVNAGEIIHRLGFWTRYFRAEEWRTSLPYLKGLDIIRFDADVLDHILPPDVGR